MSITFAANLTKMIDAGLGGELVAPDTSVAVGYHVEDKDVSGSLASWNDPEGGLPLKSLVVAFDPIQSGTGDPSPENIRPISGRTMARVTRTAANMFGGALMRDSIKAAIPTSVDHPDDGYIAFGSNSNQIAAFTDKCGLSYRFKENTQYTFIITYFKNVGGSSNMRIVYTDGTAANIPQHANITSKGTSVLVSAANKTVGRFEKVNHSGSTGVYYNESGIFEGVLTANDFVPYNGQSVEVQLGDTVYGGILDVVSGMLMVEWANIASYNGETLPGEWISDRDVYAEGTTPTTGAQVCYKLADPLIVQLSAQAIASLKGQNHLWSDAGDVSVTWKEKTYTEGY